MQDLVQGEAQKQLSAKTSKSKGKTAKPAAPTLEEIDMMAPPPKKRKSRQSHSASATKVAKKKVDSIKHLKVRQGSEVGAFLYLAAASCQGFALPCHRIC